MVYLTGGTYTRETAKNAFPFGEKAVSAAPGLS